MPAALQAQQIHLQRDAAAFCLPAQSAHMAAVHRRIPLETDHIRVGKIGEQARIHGLDGLIHIPLQHILVPGQIAAVGVAVFIADEMLPQQQIIHGILPQQRQQLREISGIILQLQPQRDFQHPGVGLPQGQHRLHIARQLLRPHPEGGIVAVGEQVGRMIRKAQNLQPGLHRRLGILPVLPHGVMAPPGMGMIICQHDTHLICFVPECYHFFRSKSMRQKRARLPARPIPPDRSGGGTSPPAWR